MAALADVKIDWKIIAAGTVAVIGLYLFFKREATAAASAAADLANPTAQDNLADRVVDGITESITMREDDSLGKFIWRVFATDEEVAALDRSLSPQQAVTR